MGFHCTTTMIDFPPELNLIVKNGYIELGNDVSANEVTTAPAANEKKDD